MKGSLVALMYTPHPAQSRLTAFVPSSLVRAAQNDVAVKFSELLEMRRVIEQMAGDLQAARPDLIPVFATGGIPFMIPAMGALYDRKDHRLVDGRHFHMFPGLSWEGKLDGVDCETYFAAEFGSLITGATRADGNLRASQDVAALVADSTGVPPQGGTWNLTQDGPTTRSGGERPERRLVNLGCSNVVNNNPAAARSVSGIIHRPKNNGDSVEANVGPS